MSDKAKEAAINWFRKTCKDTVDKGLWDSWWIPSGAWPEDAFLAGVEWSRQTDHALPSVHVEAKRQLRIAVEALEEIGKGTVPAGLEWQIAKDTLKKLKEAEGE